MVLPLAPGRFCPSLPFPDGSLSFRCLSELPGSPVLLGSYASRVLPWVAGDLSSCHPSGGASLILQNLVVLGGAPPAIRRACFLSDCTLKSWLWPRLGVLGIPWLGFSVALLPGAVAVSFAFVMVVTLCSGTSLLLGWWVSLCRPGQHETNRTGEGYSLWARSGLPGPLGATYRWRCVPFLLPQVVA